MRVKPSRRSKKSIEDDDDELPVRNVGDIKRKRSWVFYGRSGTGKTTIASSFPKPLLLLDVSDEGTDSIADIEDIQVRDIEEWDDLEHTYWWLVKNPDAYKTIVIDTVTQLQSKCVEKILAAKKKDASRAGEWGSMTKGEWGDVARAMKTWLERFRSLPMEVVFLAQDRVFNFDDDSGDSEEQLAPEVGPRLSPSVASALNAMVSVIGNTFTREKVRSKKGENGKIVEKRKIEYCLRVGPNPVYVTKLRKPKVIEAPAFIVDPTYEDLIEAIKGE